MTFSPCRAHARFRLGEEAEEEEDEEDPEDEFDEDDDDEEEEDEEEERGGQQLNLARQQLAKLSSAS